MIKCFLLPFLFNCSCRVPQLIFLSASPASSRRLMTTVGQYISLTFVYKTDESPLLSIAEFHMNIVPFCTTIQSRVQFTCLDEAYDNQVMSCTFMFKALQGSFKPSPVLGSSLCSSQPAAAETKECRD